jgi:hypothetical protein
MRYPRKIKAPDTIGDTAWLMGETGWTLDKVCRLARQGEIPGAFKVFKGVKGGKAEPWSFRKSVTREWLRRIETPLKPELAKAPA